MPEGSDKTGPICDDEYAVNLSQTQYCEGINSGNADAAMEVVADGFTWMRHGEPSYWGAEGNGALRKWMEKLIAGQSHITITPDNTEFFSNNRPAAGWALARGWEAIDSPATCAGGGRKVRYRYFQTWEKSQDGRWRMTAFMCNEDVPPKMLDE